MELIELADRFSSASVQRAEQYVRSGAVRITELAPGLVKAVVRGSSPYDVTLRIDRRRLSLSCDCPAFSSFGPCKHLWATLMVAEQRGILRQLSSFAPVDATSDDKEPELSHLAHGAPPFSVALVPSAARKTGASPPAFVPAKPPAPAPEWKTLLESARSAPALPRRLLLPTAASWSTSSM